MQSLLLDDTGDLVLDGQGALRMVDGADELAQALRLRLATATGEWFLDLGFGAPWMDGILGAAAPDLDLIRAELLQVIAQERRIAGVEDLELTFDRGARQLLISFVVRGTGGETATGEVTVG